MWTSSTLFTFCSVSVIVYIKRLSETRSNWNQPLVNNQAFSTSFLRMPNSTAPVIRYANIEAELKLMLAHTTEDLLSPPANRGTRRGSNYVYWKRRRAIILGTRANSQRFLVCVARTKCQICRSGTQQVNTGNLWQLIKLAQGIELRASLSVSSVSKRGRFTEHQFLIDDYFLHYAFLHKVFAINYTCLTRYSIKRKFNYFAHSATSVKLHFI